MINLIPPQAKKQVTREYWTRVVSTWLILFAVVFGVSFVLLVPSYVLLHSQLTEAEVVARTTSQSEADFREAEKLVRRTNDIAAQLNKPQPPVTMHEVIAAVEDVAGPDISVTTYTMARSELLIDSVTVRGTARSRSALAGFKDSLEGSVLFETAVVPISDLAREANLPFAITVSIAPQQQEL